MVCNHITADLASFPRRLDHGIRHHCKLRDQCRPGQIDEL